MVTINDELASWSTIGQQNWPSLLVGNGLSINLWASYDYENLYNKAELNDRASALFLDLETTNFEMALESIFHARLVAGVLGNSFDDIDDLYSHIRDSLFAAVAGVHIPREVLLNGPSQKIATALGSHKSIFTTNYDLNLYWSHLYHDPSIKDFFWDSMFDDSNAELFYPSDKSVHYLHGAVHLWQDDEGRNGKWSIPEGEDLRNLANRYSSANRRRPLFVSEGTSNAKVRSITQSPYLEFCLDSLQADKSDIVVFGFSFSQQDQHIVKALSSHSGKTIAVSIYPSDDPNKIIGMKTRILADLGANTVVFFNSTTHPLGDSKLRVESGGSEPVGNGHRQS